MAILQAMALPWKARAAIAAVVAAVVGAVAFAPQPLSSPIRRVANYRADSANPIFNVPLDAGALRRAGELIPDDARETWFVHTRPEPQLGHDLLGAGLLFFTPALPAADAARARWILSYEARTRLPAGVEAQRTYRLGDAVYLVRVRPR